jgi:hypothetical protein
LPVPREEPKRRAKMRAAAFLALVAVFQVVTAVPTCTQVSKIYVCTYVELHIQLSVDVSQSVYSCCRINGINFVDPSLDHAMCKYVVFAELGFSSEPS